MNPLEEVLTITEAAMVWNIDTSTLRWAILKGRFKDYEYRKTERSILILKEAVIRLYGEPTNYINNFPNNV